MNPQYQIFLDDSLKVLKTLPNNYIDSLITDPPAGISFLKNDWDTDKGGRDQWIKWMESVMNECLRVMKPGAFGFVWALPRTSHWTAMALENSGFQIKDVITHVFGSGFPKSMDVDSMIKKSKRLDLTDDYKVTGWIRKRKEEKGFKNYDINRLLDTTCASLWTARPPSKQVLIPKPEKWQKIQELFGQAPKDIQAIVKRRHQGEIKVNEERINAAQQWKGWGTNLKPASEHWILVQKPVAEQNVAANVLKHRTGALNIDASRAKSDDLARKTRNLDFRKSPFFGNQTNQQDRAMEYVPNDNGRFPSNFILTGNKTGCPIEFLDKSAQKKVSHYFKRFRPEHPFVYAAKPSKKEKGEFNAHPTVKPLALMRYFIKMITPPSGITLDPFMGSGTTGVAALLDEFHFIGLEKNPQYFDIAQKRLSGVMSKKNKKDASAS